MRKSVIAAWVAVTTLVGAPAYAQWVPGSEITGQAVQVETNGVINTVYFDQGGTARIMTPGGATTAGTWTAANGQLCLSAGANQECWPYQQAFQAGQQVTLVSSCQSTSRFTAMGTNPTGVPRSERGR
jgi:hypothetical protein